MTALITKLLTVNDEAYNTLAWLLGYVKDEAKNYDGSDKSDMETRLMKINALMYAITEVENKI